jgi:hypothetical protein
LPSDSKARRVAQAEVLLQTLVEDHYTLQKPGDKPITYSDELFKEAAIQWLVETDQVFFSLSFVRILSNLFHSRFKHLNTILTRR